MKSRRKKKKRVPSVIEVTPVSREMSKKGDVDVYDMLWKVNISSRAACQCIQPCNKRLGLRTTFYIYIYVHRVTHLPRARGLFRQKSVIAGRKPAKSKRETLLYIIYTPRRESVYIYSTYIIKRVRCEARKKERKFLGEKKEVVLHIYARNE